MVSFALNVNGQGREVEAHPDMPLLWVLRDLLDLTGTRFGCGQGLCGACTVHLDGKAIRSCITPISNVGSAPITTIEGLAQGSRHLLQQAWIDELVPECGYCQAGQIMEAAALLSRTPAPGDAEINEAMSGNLCRCGTYLRIRKAIHLAAGDAS